MWVIKQAPPDEGVDIESISVLMGHGSSKTTEKYYARKRNDKAAEEAMKTWELKTPKDRENDDKSSISSKTRSAEDGVRTHDLRISLEEVC